MATNAKRTSWLTGGNKKKVYGGIYAFTTTSATKDVEIPLTRVESVFITPIGTPGTASSTLSRTLGAVTATTSFPIITPPYAGTLTAVKITVDTTHAVHEDNHWSFTLVNKGAAGAGTTDMILATAANSTDTTGGAAITAFIPRALTLHGTAANLVTAAGDVLAFVATKAASAVSLSGATIELTFASGAAAESLSVNETVGGTAGLDDAVILGANGVTTLTIQRNAINPTSGLKFSLVAIGN